MNAWQSMTTMFSMHRTLLLSHAFACETWLEQLRQLLRKKIPPDIVFPAYATIDHGNVLWDQNHGI